MEIVCSDRTQTWKKVESLKRHCSAKRKYKGVGKQMVLLMVAIAQ